MKVVEQGNSSTIQAEEPFGSGGERRVSRSGNRSEVTRKRLLCAAGGLRPALDEAVTVEWEGSRWGGVCRARDREAHQPAGHLVGAGGWELPFGGGGDFGRM